MSNFRAFLEDPAVYGKGGPIMAGNWYRGVVEDVVDPESRGRVRVRVPCMHGFETPTFALPWAERCLPDGGGPYGDHVPLKASTATGAMDGDKVWVIFENGLPHLPVIVGTWRSPADAVAFEPAEGNPRRRVIQTRHGTSLQFCDEPGEFELKVTMPSGHVLHMRESPGGAGVHVSTAKGHWISMQDEGTSSTNEDPATNAYDESHDVSHVRGQDLQIEHSSPATGSLRSPTAQKAKGLGAKGVNVQSSSGHRVRMLDESGILLVQSAKGHRLTFDDNLNSIRAHTLGGNSVLLQDGLGVTVSSQWGQSIFFNASSFGISWPANNMHMTFGSDGGGTTEWYINGSMNIQATGNITIQSGGVLSTIGASRIEVPADPI